MQGVGFRPFIYRLATRYGLAGWVLNTNENVKIRVSGKNDNLEQFRNALMNEEGGGWR